VERDGAPEHHAFADVLPHAFGPEDLRS
jgi:hypothetical protein